jgi:hypothetical protein
MPKYEIEVSFTITYTAVKLITAKDEETAREKVEKAFEDIIGLRGFQKYIGGDSEVVEDYDCSINAVIET